MHLDEILDTQAGVITREQLRACGVSRGDERAQLDAGRWRPLNDAVICTHNGPLTVDQARWAVVLSAQGPTALCGLTGLAIHGVRGFETIVVHVLVRRGARVLPIPGVDMHVHESRRFGAADILPVQPPVTTIERSTIDAAAWSLDIKTATRVIVAAVQQRRTTAARLRDALAEAGQIKYRPVLVPFIADLEGGAEALSEVAFLRWCRKHGFPKPECNVRLDSHGKRRYLDVEFRRADGTALRAEIDGGVHLNLMTRWEDTAKDNDDVIARRTTLRFPSVAIYTNDARAIRQLHEGLRICPQ